MTDQFFRSFWPLAPPVLVSEFVSVRLSDTKIVILHSSETHRDATDTTQIDLLLLLLILFPFESTCDPLGSSSSGASLMPTEGQGILLIITRVSPKPPEPPKPQIIELR